MDRRGDVGVEVWKYEMRGGEKKKSESGSDRSRDDMMWGLNTPGNGEMRGETMGGHMNI